MTQEISAIGVNPKKRTQKKRVGMSEKAQKTAHIKKVITEMARHAEDKFSLGVRYYIIAQKLGRYASHAGISMTDILEELDKEGAILLYTDHNYSKLIMAPEVRDYLKYNDLGEETEETKNIIKAKWGRK